VVAYLTTKLLPRLTASAHLAALLEALGSRYSVYLLY
jgi:hypothetical protein